VEWRPFEVMAEAAMRWARWAAVAAIHPGLALAQDVPLAWVARYPAPPAGFRPDVASDSELARYGLPARPVRNAAHPQAYDSWLRAMRAARVYVAPVVRMLGRLHRPATELLRTQATAATSGNWAGEALQNSSTGYGATAFTEVMGQWVISGVQQAVGMCGGTDYSATWVGIDGLTGTGDVLQAGTEADATCTGGDTYVHTYAWYEWYPANTYELMDFPAPVGGSMFVVVQAVSATSATASFVNLQTGAYTAFAFGAPSGTKLAGDSAEWVEERPTPNGSKSPGTLADFGEVPMESEIGYLVDQLNTPNFEVPGQPTAGQTSETLTMTNSAGTAIATVVPQGVSAELVQVAGPTQ
jgi:hypothetical protein